MSGELVRSDAPVTLVGGGPVEQRDIDEALALAPAVVAADGGLNHVAATAVRPAAVIGDMDSVRPSPAGIPAPRYHHVSEQDSTDFEKCLRGIVAPLIVGIGFLGGRADHHLAAMNALVRYSDRPVLLLGGADICFCCPAELRLELEAGQRVSLFPMAPVVGRVSEGLRWSVEGLDMRPDGRIGTSNMALGGPVRLGFDAPRVLVILPRRELGQVSRVLVRTAA